VEPPTQPPIVWSDDEDDADASPAGQTGLGKLLICHMVDGSIECFKARIVAKGYSQCLGLDYNESFVPTFCPATLRIIMAMSAVDVRVTSIGNHAYCS